MLDGLRQGLARAARGDSARSGRDARPGVEASAGAGAGPRRRRGSLAAALLLALTFFGTTGAGQDASAPAEPRPPTRADAARALERVKADPNLGGERRIRMLRWIQDDEPQKPAGWLEWLAGFFGWFVQTARALVWVSGVLLAGLLAYTLVRLLRTADTASLLRPPQPLPTHVRDLDIRPESLPDDIGTVARQLWDAGDHRAALALLYRGLLSRLVHVHDVPIRDSSTEGDCLALAALHLSQNAQAYAGTLIPTWQRTVYGGYSVETAAVHALCDGFAAALRPAAPADVPLNQSSAVQP
jgi:hypothetical protein